MANASAAANPQSNTHLSAAAAAAAVAAGPDATTAQQPKNTAAVAATAADTATKDTLAAAAAADTQATVADTATTDPPATAAADTPPSAAVAAAAAAADEGEAAKAAAESARSTDTPDGVEGKQQQQKRASRCGDDTTSKSSSSSSGGHSSSSSSCSSSGSNAVSENVTSAAHPSESSKAAQVAASDTRSSKSSSGSSSGSSDSNSSSSSSSSSVGAEAKQRARLKRQFVRTPWLDINKAPSWPPIKKNKFLDTDWKIVDFRPQTPETKRSRLFLNSLCYLCEGVITKKSTLGRKAGLGLFCAKTEGFIKGTIITEFVGWLVDREQAEQLRRKRRASHIVAVQKGFLYIDGVKEPFYGTGGASFANDGSEFLGGPGNNAVFHHWFDEELGRTRVFLRATRNIADGEEIFVPYDKTYWQDNFEEQEENCPDAFRKKKIEQLQRKYKDFTITSMEDLKARQALLEQQRREKQEKVKAGKKKPPKPNVKRPLSAFMRFSVERRRELVEENPELKHPKCFKEIAQRISNEWKELNLQKKQEFEQQAAADFNKYKQKVREWRAKHTPKTKKKNRKNNKIRHHNSSNHANTPTPSANERASETANANVDTAAAAEAAEPIETEASSEALGGHKSRTKELKQTDVEVQSQESPIANAATDVPESTVDSSTNSRQSSGPEVPDATGNSGASRYEDKKEAPVEATACASTAG